MGGYSMNFVECPICKKKFIPAPEHAWKIESETIVCSYHCMRQWEYTHGKKRRKDTNYGAKLRDK